jgi:hypothetical protein
MKRPPVTSRSFGLESGYLMSDAMKKAAGCGMCKRKDIPANALLWWDNKEQCLVNEDVFLASPYFTAMEHYVVCLDCVQRVRAIKVPKIQRMTNGNTSSK